MTPQRLQLEVAILERYFPKRYKLENLGQSNEFLDVGVKTQKGNIYRLKIALSSDYPASLPKVYISYPENLRDYHGNSLLKVSASMHTLTPDNNMPQICHLKGDNWNPNRSLFQIVMKARLWLEAFDMHLESGRVLDDFLPENPDKQNN